MKAVIIGYGNLGKIYAHSFIKYGVLKKEHIYLALKKGKKTDDLYGKVLPEKGLDKIKPDILILAVKPQDYQTIIKQAAALVCKKTIVISVMAGISIKQLQNNLGHQKIVRAMPNSPVEIGMGMTGYTAAEELTMDEIKKAESLLSTTGRIMYFEKEEDLDAVTALSGSGPAYFFYIIQSMIEAGKAMGFSESTAANLVKQTMLGSFHLYNHSGKSTAELIKTVASKGGTTEAAFEQFEAYQLKKGIQKGILSARKRAKELSRN